MCTLTYSGRISIVLAILIFAVQHLFYMHLLCSENVAVCHEQLQLKINVGNMALAKLGNFHFLMNNQ